MSLESYVPSGQSFMLLAIAILLTGISYFVQSKSQKKAIRRKVFSWIPIVSRGRRTSTSKTPPRSLSPEKKMPSNTHPPSEYKDIFPPSTRGNLPVWTKSWKLMLAGLRSTSGEAEVNQVVPPGNVIGLEKDYRECDSSTYTSMGMSIAEVRALGDFPDYSKLSGVCLPQAYKEHKLETAIPRPYRPFRWAYHQTMCMTSIPVNQALANTLHSSEQDGDRLVARA